MHFGWWVLFIGVVLLARAPQAHAELIVTSQRVWGVESQQRAGHVLQYLACNAAGGACVSVGVGNGAALGAPIAINHTAFRNGTLRARYCQATPTGGASTVCSAMSDPSPGFLFDAALTPPFVLSIPAPEDRQSSNPALSSGTHQLILPLPAVVPVSSMLRLWFLDATGPNVNVSLLVGSTVVGSYTCSPCRGSVSVQVRDAVTEALHEGAREITVRLAWSGRPGQIGLALPGSGAAEIPHLRLTLPPIGLYDLDADGVMNDGDRTNDLGDTPCAPGEWVACDDNCGGVPNPAQADANGDGFGDACDPNGDPARNALGGALAPLSLVECMLEWRFAREVPLTDAMGLPTNTPSCKDGDRRCDLDAVPGQCTFGVSVCLNVRDPRLSRCAPSELTRLAFSLSSYVGSNQTNISALIPAAGLPNRQINSCGPFASLVVPAGNLLAVSAVAQGYTATSSAIDTDAVSMGCVR